MARQRGFALIELVIAGILATLIAVWASQTLVNKLNDSKIDSVASWMEAVHKALSAYLIHYSNDIRQEPNINNLVFEGFASWSDPTLEELKQNGFLGQGFPVTISLIGGVSVHVFRSGVCPSENCHITAIVLGNKPLLTNSGKVNEQMLAQWIMASKGKGGTVHPDRSNRLMGKLFEYSNPLPNGFLLVPGTIALVVADHDLPETNYLKVRDTRDPQFQDSLTVASNIAALGNLSTDGYLKINSNAQLMQPCSENNAISFNSNYGLLMCSYGLWRNAGRSLGGYSLNTKYGCFTSQMRPSINPVTGSCSCPLGSLPVVISEGSTGSEADGITNGFICVD